MDNKHIENLQEALKSFGVSAYSIDRDKLFVIFNDPIEIYNLDNLLVVASELNNGVMPLNIDELPIISFSKYESEESVGNFINHINSIREKTNNVAKEMLESSTSLTTDIATKAVAPLAVGLAAGMLSGGSTITAIGAAATYKFGASILIDTLMEDDLDAAGTKPANMDDTELQTQLELAHDDASKVLSEPTKLMIRLNRAVNTAKRSVGKDKGGVEFHKNNSINI